MLTKVDARGLTCPQPVIATKKALDAMPSGVVVTLVDNVISRENVMKFAAAQGCGAELREEADGSFAITISKGNGVAALPALPELTAAAGATVVVITRDTVGDGNRELGGVLMKSFLFTLQQSEPLPAALVFMNGGVLLTLDDSPVREHLTALAAAGVPLLVCGTCLDYYDVKERLAVGGISNMYSIVETMQQHAKVITL